jgi:glycine oxidase
LPDEAQVDPPMLLRALQQACAALGVVFRTGLTVTGVSSAGVTTQEGVIEADAIVVAAGSWSSMLTGLPSELRRVRPVRGQIVQVDTRPPIVKNIVFGDRGYVVARPDGRTILGSTMEEAGHMKEVTVAGIHAVLSQSLALLPGLADAPITATWCGFRPATSEDRPLIGRVDDRVFVATGHHRNGILLSAETARLVADLIATGTCDRDLTTFSPRR